MADTTGGDGLVAALLDHGIDTIFGIPGAQTYGLFDALYRNQNKIRLIGARHEHACSLMAYGYARSTGRSSAYTVVPGPGMLNASGGILTAWAGNEPTLMLTGQVPSAYLDKGKGHLHEMPDQLATMRTLVKYAERAESPAVARGAVARAIQQMTSGRRGPAAIEMPWDVFVSKSDIGPAVKLDPHPAPTVDDDAIAAAAKLIRGARNPMIFVGGGAIHARAAVLELAERLDAPVVAKGSGRGIVSNDHPLGLTIAEAYGLWAGVDLAIGIGTRMELANSWWGGRPADLPTIRIDIDPAERRRTPADVFVIGDSAQALALLNDAVAKDGYTRDPDRLRQIAEEVAKTRRTIESVQPQIDYLKVLRDVLPRNAIVTEEPCQLGFASWYGFPVYEPRTFITSGFQGNLGAGFATALGAKVAHPDRAVVAITGDGGFMFGVAELATAVQYGIGVIVVVYNNDAFENVRRDQAMLFEGRQIGSDLVNPDFMKLCEAFGVKGQRVDNPGGFKAALEAALADGGPNLIEITAGSGASPWPFILPAGPPK